jgi:hypothetical protein
LESGGGKRDNCQNKGLYNGYGYRQNKFEQICYQSHKEVRTHVENWIKDKAEKGYTLNEILCFYNQGIKTNDCQYAKNYARLQ